MFLDGNPPPNAEAGLWEAQLMPLRLHPSTYVPGDVKDLYDAGMIDPGLNETFTSPDLLDWRNLYRHQVARPDKPSFVPAAVRISIHASFTTTSQQQPTGVSPLR